MSVSEIADALEETEEVVCRMIDGMKSKTLLRVGENRQKERPELTDRKIRCSGLFCLAFLFFLCLVTQSCEEAFFLLRRG